MTVLNNERSTARPLDLQLFSVSGGTLFTNGASSSTDANLNVNLTGATGEGNNLSAEMKVFYDKNLLVEATPNLIHAQFGQKRRIPRGGGKKIEFRRFSSLGKSSSALTEGVTPSGQSVNVSAVEATLSQYGGFVTYSDMLDLTAVDPVLTEITSLLGSQAGMTLDGVVRDVINAGTNVIYAPTVSGSTVTEVTDRDDMNTTSLMSVKLIQKAVTKLKGENAKPFEGGDYVAIIHPYVAYDLMRDPEWIDWQKYTTPDAMFRGEIGKIGNVRFVESSEAKIWNGSDCPVKTAANGSTPATYYSVFSTLVMGANAYGVVDLEGGGLETIVKPVGSGGSADPLDQRGTVGWKAAQAAKILNNAYLVRIETLSGYDSTAEAN